jgi:RND family efflux transporter MFP subunit
VNTPRPLFLLAIAMCCLVAPAQSAEQGVVSARPSFTEIALTGFSRARASLPLVAESSGKVMEVAADIGQAIDAVGLFARLDERFISLDLEANRIQQAQIRSRLAYAGREAQRYRELAKKGSASKSRLDELEQTLRDNQHRLDELAIQEKVLEERLRRTRVTAPVGWHVIDRRVEPGQRVNEGEVLGAVSDFSTLLVPYALSPEQLATLRRQADPLSLYLPDWDLTVSTRIHRINPGFDPVTRKTAIDLAIEDKLPDRRGGLRAILALRMPESTGAVMLPESAVEQSYEEFWVTRDSGDRLRVVKLGNHAGPDGTWLRIASPDIQPGDWFRLTEGH